MTTTATLLGVIQEAEGLLELGLNLPNVTNLLGNIQLDLVVVDLLLATRVSGTSQWTKILVSSL